jgi:predicted deacylase
LNAVGRRRVTGGTADGREVGVNVVEVTGRGDGPTIAVVGGVHGDEFEGVVATDRLISELEAADLRGRAILVPVAHEAAHFASTRTSPIDGLNLARTFPGRAAGSATEVVADIVRREVIEPADLLIDLHSAGVAFAMPLLVGWTACGCDACNRGTEAAGAFAAPVLWREPGPPAPGRTLTSAHDAGIPSIYAEASGGGTVTVAEAEMYVAGVRRVMGTMGMMDEPPIDNDPIRLVGGGDLDKPSLTSPIDGVCQVFVRVLDDVRPGQLLATVVDPLSGATAEVRSEVEAVVVLARRAARISAGDMLISFADRDAG